MKMSFMLGILSINSCTSTWPISVLSSSLGPAARTFYRGASDEPAPSETRGTNDFVATSFRFKF